jgi:CheY-like chemotaxis protein
MVEGHEEARALYALALSANGFEVVAVKDGQEALNRASQIHPDIIVTALPMPNYDGRQFLQDLRQTLRTRDIPVVAVSGSVQRSLRDCVERDDFTACFSKLCRPDELAAGLRQLLDGKPPADEVRLRG